MSSWADFLAANRVSVRLVTDQAEAERLLAGLEPEVAFDIETCPAVPGGSGLDPWTGKIRLASFYSGGPEALVVDFAGMDVGAVLGRLAGKRLVAFYATFEASFTIMAGLDLVYDDAVLALGLRLDRDKFRGVDLDTVARRLRILDPPSSADKTRMQKSDFGAVELTGEQFAYSATDAVVTWRLWEELSAEREVYADAYAIAAQAIPATARMMLRGLPFDLVSHLWISDEWKRILKRETLELRRINGLEPTSGQKLGERLRATLAPDLLARWPRTPTGRLSTKGKLLVARGLANATPEVTQFLRASSLKTLTKSFGHDLAKKINSATGRLHGSLGLAQARTGRYTSSGPNLQNLPAGPFRRVFAAAEGRRILSADYSAIELRISCLLAREKTLVEVFKHAPRLDNGKRNPLGDPHQQVTDQLKLDPKTNVKHRLSKALNYSTLYGTSPAGFANNAGISEEEARQHLDGYWKLRAQLFAWQRTTNRKTLDSRKAVTLKGREVTCVIPAKYHAKEPAVQKEYERVSLQRGLNVPIQGAAAELMLLAVYYVDRELLEARKAANPIDADLLLTVHDELVVEAAEGDCDRAADIMRRGMCRAFADLFSQYEDFEDVARYVVGDIDIGQTWGGDRLDPAMISAEDKELLFKGLLEEVIAGDGGDELDDDEGADDAHPMPRAIVDDDDDEEERAPKPAEEPESKSAILEAKVDNLDLPDFLNRKLT